jgi:hypothetical protein
MRRIVSLIVILLISFFLVNLLQADTYMKEKKHTDGMKMMGTEQPATDEITEVWITSKGIRSDSPKGSMIMLVDEKKIIMIDHQNKTYTEMPMNMGDIASQAAKEAGKDDEDAEKMNQANQAMMQGMKMEITVQPTAETKKIKNWNCKKYNMTMNTFMGPMSNEIWATEDLKIDKAMYTKLMTAFMSAMPGMQSGSEKMIKEVEKIKGVQVFSITKHEMMGQTMSSSTELLEFKDGTAPANLFKIPAGYKKKAMMSED